MRTRRQARARALAEAAGPPDPVPLIFTLPEELLGDVTSFLPTESLKALALTHSRLLPHARARLVAHVYIGGYTVAQSAIAWFKRASPALRRRSRHLTINGVVDHFSPYGSRATEAQLAQLLVLVPHLKALTIKSYSTGYRGFRPSLARALRELSGLEELDLANEYVYYVGVVLGALPDGLSLRRLHLGPCYLASWSTAQQDFSLTVGELRGPLGMILNASARLPWVQSARALAGGRPDPLDTTLVAMPLLEALLLHDGLSVSWGRIECPRLALIACTRAPRGPRPIGADLVDVTILRTVRTLVNPTLLRASSENGQYWSPRVIASNQLPSLDTVYIPEAEADRLAICWGDIGSLDQWVDEFRRARPNGSVRTYSWPFGADLRHLDLLALLDRGEFVETLCRSSTWQ